MTLLSLDHVNVRTDNLDTMIHWYTSVLGMSQGRRPDFSFSGAWMYLGDRAIVHLVGADGMAGVGSEANLKLEHFAFTADDWPGFEARLVASGEAYQCNKLTGFGIMQCNINDPDGNHIHVDFALE